MGPGTVCASLIPFLGMPLAYRIESGPAWRSSDFATLAMVLLLFAHSLLPNRIEGLLLTANLSVGVYQMPLMLTAALVLAASLGTASPGIAVSGLACLSLLALSVLMSGEQVLELGMLLAASHYLLPVAGLLAARDLVRHPRRLHMLVIGLWLLLVVQGIVVLADSFIPFIGESEFGRQGNEFREGFGAYRFGSTLASANTSGCLLALCLAAAFRLQTDKSTRRWFLLFTILALLGYLSRSGAVLLLVLLLADRARVSLANVLVALLALFSAMMLITLLRSATDLVGSNSMRVLLFLEAYGHFESSSATQWLLGRGPGTAFGRDLAAYYGATDVAGTGLLSATESALIVIALELGLVGAALLLWLVFVCSGRKLWLSGAFVVYLVLDPSFLRPYEGLLSITLLTVAARTPSTVSWSSARSYAAAA